MRGIEKNILTAIKYIYFATNIFLLISILMLESPRNVLNGVCSSRTMNAILIIFCIVFLCLAVKLFRKFPNKIGNDSFMKYIKLFNVALFFVQIIVIYNIMFYTAWDCGEIRDLSWKYVQDGIMDPEYLSRNPNNMYLTFITIGIMKTFQFFNSFDTIHYILLCCFVLSVNIATFLVVSIVYKITNNISISIVCYLVSIFTFAISPWITIPYSDTLSIVFPIMELYIYVNKEWFKQRYLYWFTLTIVSIVGAYIKPTCIIVFMAIIIIEFFKKEHNWKYVLTKSAIAIFIAAVIPFSMNEALKNKVGVEEEMAFTWAHFLMMGMNEDTWGRWDLDDFCFSVDIPTKSDRQIQDLKRFRERIDAYGVKGTIKQFMRKTNICYGDGTFAWGDEGKFFFVLLDRQSRISTVLKKVFLPNIERSRYLYFSCLEQFFWIMVITLQYGIVKVKEDERKISYVVMLSLVGIFMFINLFEARGRYLYNYVPIFIISSAYGLKYLYEKNESEIT